MGLGLSTDHPSPGALLLTTILIASIVFWSEKPNLGDLVRCTKSDVIGLNILIQILV